MKKIYCAGCGEELFLLRKAIKSQQTILTLVEPHKCLDKKNIKLPFVDREIEPIEKESPIDLDKEFEDFEFVKKLNNLDPPTGDRRKKDEVREEITSSAPDSVIENVRSMKGGD